RSRELAAEYHGTRWIGRRGDEDVVESAPFGRESSRQLVRGAVARFAAQLHVIVALGVYGAVAVQLLLGVAVDARQAPLEVHVGGLLAVGVAVQQVLIVSVGLAAFGWRLHHAAEVHGGA